MVISSRDIDINLLQTTKNRIWFKENVYKIWRFRKLFELRQETKEVGQKTRLEGKIRHLQNKINDLAAQGKLLGLKDEQIRNINQLIVERIKKGDRPETIIQRFIPKKSQNN